MTLPTKQILPKHRTLKQPLTFQLTNLPQSRHKLKQMVLDNCFSSNWLNQNFQNSQGITQHNGSLKLISFLNIRILLNLKRYRQLPSIQQERQTNGGSIYSILARRNNWSQHGNCLKKNCGLSLGQQSMKTLMRLYPRSNKWVVYVIISRNLKNWGTQFTDSLKRL